MIYIQPRDTVAATLQPADMVAVPETNAIAPMICCKLNGHGVANASAFDSSVRALICSHWVTNDQFMASKRCPLRPGTDQMAASHPRDAAVFAQHIDAVLPFQIGPLHNPTCRWADYRDMKVRFPGSGVRY